MLPEPEKQAARILYVQAIKNLGFNGAEDIIRKPVADLAGIAALLPPELQQPFLLAAQQIGMVPPAAAPGAAGAPPAASPAPSAPPTT